MARIEDAFSLIRNGANIKQGLDDSGYPITRIETISNRTIDRNKMGYAGIADISKYADYVLQDGDILMSHINSETHLGKVALYEKQENEIIIHGMNLLCLRPKQDLLDSRFAFYYLSSETFLRQIPRITKKSVNQASFNVAALKELTIPIPAIEKQKDIVRKLAKVNELIALRKEQLAKLDQLVKARFAELFGNWRCELEPLQSFLEDITYGFTNPMPDAEEGPWKITARDVINGKINYDTARKTTLQAFEELTAKSKPTVGDVLLTKDGTLGRCAVVKEDGICVNQSVAVLKCNKRILPEFLVILLQMPEYQREMLKNAGGGTIKHIYITKVVDMLIMVPTVSKQLEFLSFVEQTDKSKLTIQASLDKLEVMKKALMQEYFG